MRREVVSAVCYAILPPLLCFGFTTTPWAALVRPLPANSFYDAMLIAVCGSVAIVEMLQQSSSGGTCEGNAFIAFQVLLALLLGVFYCLARAPASGAAWLLVAAALAACVGMPAAAALPPSTPPHDAESADESSCLVQPPQQSHQQEQQQAQEQPKLIWTWSFSWTRPPLVWAFSAFLVCSAVLFVALPVLQPWSGPPEPFVRWVPYTTAGELVWRGVFASYAVMMLWSGLEGPLGKHLPFTSYLAVSGCLHASLMLAMNLWERARGGPNGNPEHIYGDIAAWYIISLFSLITLLLHHNTNWTQKKQC